MQIDVCSCIVPLKAEENLNKKVMIKKLVRNYENDFNHSLGTFEHAFDQNCFFEQNDSYLDHFRGLLQSHLDQCAL